MTNKHIKIVAFIAILIILIGTFVFVGCKKEDKNPNNILSEPTSESFSIMNICTTDYGALHNILTDYILEEREYFSDGILSPDYVTTDDILNLIEMGRDYFLEYDTDNIYTSIAIQESNALIEFVSAIGDDTNGRSNLLKIFRIPDSTMITNLLLSKGYSTELIDFIYPCIEVAASDMNIRHDDIVGDYIRPIFLHSFVSNTDEFAAKTICIQTYEHSAFYWNNEPFQYSTLRDTTKKRNPNLPDGVQDCEEWAIIMDMVGAMLGSPLTVIGSSILSAALSIAAKRDCEAYGQYA